MYLVCKRRKLNLSIFKKPDVECINVTAA